MAGNIQYTLSVAARESTTQNYQSVIDPETRTLAEPHVTRREGTVPANPTQATITPEPVVVPAIRVVDIVLDFETSAMGAPATQTIGVGVNEAGGAGWRDLCYVDLVPTTSAGVKKRVIIEGNNTTGAHYITEVRFTQTAGANPVTYAAVLGTT